MLADQSSSLHVYVANLYTLLRIISITHIATQSIMCCVPCAQLRNRYLEQLVSLRPAVQSDDTLADLVSTHSWDHIDPAYVVKTANDEAVGMLVRLATSSGLSQLT